MTTPTARTYLHQCEGGPWGGRWAESRYKAGFWLVHKASATAWSYVYSSLSDKWVMNGSEGYRRDRHRHAPAMDLRVMEADS